MDNLRLANHGQEVGPSGHQRLNHNLDVPELVLERVARGPIVALSDKVPHFLLNVALLVVLLHLSGHPLEVHN